MQQQKICCFSKIFQWCHRTGDEKSQIQILPLHPVLTEYGIWLGLRPMLSKWLELTKLRVAGQNSNVPGISRGICLLWVSPWADKTMTGKRQLPPDREKQKSKWRAATYQKARKCWGQIHALGMWTLLWLQRGTSKLGALLRRHMPFCFVLFSLLPNRRSLLSLRPRCPSFVL